MADKKISELTTLTTTATGDLIPLVDVDASETKHVTRANLFGQDLTDSDSPSFAGLTVNGTTRIASANSTNAYSFLALGGADATAKANIRSSTNGDIQFWNAASGSTTEKMRINSSGNVLIGTPTTGASILRVVGLPTSSAGLSSGDVWNDSGTLKIV